MQKAVVTEQKMRNLNVRQENAMFNLAAVQSVVPLRECKLSALAATVQWLYQRRFASAQHRHRLGTASDHLCPESLSDRRVLVSARRSYSQLDWGLVNSLARHLVQWTGVSCRSSSMVSCAQCAGALSCLNMQTSPDIRRISGNICCFFRSDELFGEFAGHSPGWVQDLVWY